MSFKARIEYLLEILKRYFEPSTTKIEKKLILDEYCRICGYNRKYAIYQINNYDPKKAKKKKGRSRVYGSEVVMQLKRLWIAMDQPCSKNMVAAIPIWLPHDPTPISEETKKLLLSISRSQIDRLLQETKKEISRKRNCTTKPGSLIKNRIPIKQLDYNILQPGVLEADTVAHCGETVSGTFANTITFTDVFSEWTENRAIWGKGATDVVERTKDVIKAVPFDVTGFSTDNGNEFLNYHLLGMLEKRQINFCRTRPYKKNDNCRVEQKNYTHVRALIGYDRFDHQMFVALLNELYTKHWNPYKNFFCPVIKMTRKVRIGSRLKRFYDESQTPYQRILACNTVPVAQKEQLRYQFERLNPFILKRNIDQMVRRILELNRKLNNKAA